MRLLRLRPLLVLALLLACNGGPPPAMPAAPTPTATTSAAASPGPTALAIEDSGKSLTVAPGASLVVKLRANSGTGYTWEVTKGDPSIVAVLGTPTTESPDPGKPGAPVVRMFTFVAKAPGTTRIEIVYHRAWERDVPPLQTFASDVTVR